MMWAKLLTLNPWVILGVVAALGISHAYVFVLGKDRAEDAAATEKLESVNRAIEQAAAIATQDMEIASANIKTVEVIRKRTRTIRIKESAHAKANPLPADCVLDAERVRNINAALAGEVATNTGQPDYTLPPAAKLAR